MSKQKTIAQQAAAIRRKYKRQGIQTIKDINGYDAPIGSMMNHKLVEHDFVTTKIEELRLMKQRLAELKLDIQRTGDSIHIQRLKEAGADVGEIKNFTLFSLDKNQKIVYKRPPKYTWDDVEREAAKSYKRAWIEDISGNISHELQYVVDLVSEMLETSNGEIDPNSVATLNQWAKKITNKNFRKMVDHINVSREAYYGKRYESFYEKDSQGADSSIVLDYAKTQPADFTLKDG